MYEYTRGYNCEEERQPTPGKNTNNGEHWDHQLKFSRRDAFGINLKS
jgi:hypothetical protein